MNQYGLKSTDFGNSGTPVIKVLGIGGGGGNAVNRMFREPIPGVEYIVMNTDAQALMRCETPVRLQLGEKLTKGLGVGGDPEKGRQAAEECREAIADLARGADMVFLAAGMGGGTGTGAAAIVAEVSREVGALTVAVCTRPFEFEGRRRMKVAEDGIHRLKDKVDSLILIPNERLHLISDQRLSVGNAFKMADDVLRQGVQAIAELVTIPGEINLDFADVRTVMGGAGPAWLGIGRGNGERRAADAARAALNCPLLDLSIEGAKGVLFNVTGGENLSMAEVHEAAESIGSMVDPEANIFFGMVQDPRMEDEVKVTIIATGFSASDLFLSSKDEELARLMAGDGNTERAPDLDLPPFLRKSYAIRRRPVRASGAD